MVIAVYVIRYGVAVRAIVYLNLSSQLPIDNDIASEFDVTVCKRPEKFVHHHLRLWNSCKSQNFILHTHIHTHTHKHTEICVCVCV
jgi:hypothetical protein